MIFTDEKKNGHRSTGTHVSDASVPVFLFFKLRGSDLVVQGFDHAKVEFRNDPRHIGEVKQRDYAWNPCPEEKEHCHRRLALAEICPL